MSIKPTDIQNTAVTDPRVGAVPAVVPAVVPITFDLIAHLHDRTGE